MLITRLKNNMTRQRKLVTKLVAFTLLSAPMLGGCLMGGEGTDAAAGSLPWPDDTAALDSNTIVIALKYVTFSENGKPVVNAMEARQVVQEINKLYKQCNIHFRVEEYLDIDPRDRGLDMNLSSMGQLTSTRAEFQDPTRLLVINTGNWIHSSMGPANAWTSMPGSAPYGAVMEGQVAMSSEIVAHELGHYLSLDHEEDTSNLMTPVIYKTSTQLQDWQCESMRETATNYWSATIRQ